MCSPTACRLVDLARCAHLPRKVGEEAFTVCCLLWVAGTEREERIDETNGIFFWECVDQGARSGYILIDLIFVVVSWCACIYSAPRALTKQSATQEELVNLEASAFRLSRPDLFFLSPEEGKEHFSIG